MSFFHSLLYSSPLEESASAEQGLTYLQENSHFFYDFSKLTGANDAAISNGNAGLVDQGPNGHTLTIVNTPLVRDLTWNGQTSKTFKDVGDEGFSMPVTGSTMFNTSAFRIWFITETQDGIATGTQNIFGGIIPTNIGIDIWFSSSGKLTLTMGNSGGVIIWQTTNVVRSNGVNGLSLWEVEVDFVADTVRMWNQGFPLAMTQFSGTISSYDFTDYDNTRNLYIGTLNNNGTATTQATVSSILAITATPQPTEAQERNIRDYFYSLFKWENEIHIETLSDVSTLRTSFRDAFFDAMGFSDLPALTPVVTADITGTIHIIATANVTGVGAWTRLAFTQNDSGDNPWVNRIYYAPSSTPNGKLAFVIQGHNSEPVAALEGFISDLAEEGYDIAFGALAVCGTNTESNGSVTNTSTTGHNQFLAAGLDDELGVHLFDKTSAISYLKTTYGYTDDDIYAVGLSGGGWCVTVWAAMDTRIKKTVCCRGTGPRSFKDNSASSIEPDLEQGGTVFTSANCGSTVYATYTAHSYIDQYLMAASSGRKFKLLTHKEDTCCFRGDFPDVIKPTVRRLATTLGGTYDSAIDTDSGRTTHQWDAWSTAEVIDFFAD